MAIQKNIFTRFQFDLTSLLWVIGGVYCCLAFIPIPYSVGIGLDPSWGYALSKTVVEKLIFGRDIIFTFGPLGYLTHGSALQQNFWTIFIFRLFVHFCLFTVTLAKLLSVKNNLFRISLSLSILFAHLTGLADFSGLTTDYQILIIYLLITYSNKIWEKKSIRWWCIGLGALSGFCLLSKFTLGIYTLGSLILSLSANIYRSSKSKLNFKNSCLGLLEALLAAISVAFILLNPNYLISFTQVLICLTGALIVALIVKVFQKLFVLHKREASISSNGLSLASISFYGFYSLGLCALAHYSFPSLTTYLKNSWEIASGYSSAMSTTGSTWELALGISQLVLILIILFFLGREGSYVFSIGLALVLALSFKHAFVRQDESHILVFFGIAPTIVTLCILQSVKNRIFFLIAHIYTLLTLSLVLLPSPRLLPNLTPNKIISNVSLLLNINNLPKQINESSTANLSQAKLPSNLLKIVKEKPIDIVPWEISLVEANNLHWKPRPIFQSYSAYTSSLDKINSQSLLTQPRDYIIYQFSSIDGRHPFFDEPETFFNIFCNYKLSSEIPDFVNTPQIFNLMLLEKRQSNICSLERVSKKTSIAWNKKFSIQESDGFLIRATVKISYSTIGKIYKTLFRGSSVKMHVTYMDEQEKSYRIIPGNSNNGVIVSHLPRNDTEALWFFKGDLPVRTKSFKFSTKNPIMYKSNIEIDLISYKLLEPSINQSSLSPLIDISKLKDIKFIDNQTDEIGYIDTGYRNADTPFKRGEQISITGWAINKSAKGKKIWVLLTYNSDNKPLAITETGLSRLDVSESLKDSEYINSGWSIDFSSENMPTGVHNIKAWIYDPIDNMAIPLIGSYQVEIK
jgi:hypothetical protein